MTRLAGDGGLRVTEACGDLETVADAARPGDLAQYWRTMPLPKLGWVAIWVWPLAMLAS